MPYLVERNMKTGECTFYRVNIQMFKDGRQLIHKGKKP